MNSVIHNLNQLILCYKKGTIPILKKPEEKFDLLNVIKLYLQKKEIVLTKQIFIDKPSYYNQMDSIWIPKNKKDTALETIYMLHEIGHSTGQVYRLNRDCFVKYHNDEKSKQIEEYTVEIFAILFTIQSMQFNISKEDVLKYISDFSKVNPKNHISDYDWEIIKHQVLPIYLYIEKEKANSLELASIFKG